MRIRIRIQQLKLMRIHADPDTDPDPKPCVAASFWETDPHQSEKPGAALEVHDGNVEVYRKAGGSH